MPPLISKVSRRASLDLIRSFAIIAVVALHVVPQSESAWVYRIFFESMSKVGVPLFLILSGYLMLDRDYTEPDRLKRFFVHNWLPMVVAFELWVFVSFLLSAGKYAIQPDGSFRDLVGGVLSTAAFWGEPYMTYFWYMQMIIGIYLFIPPLASFLHTVVSKGCRVWVHVVMSLLLVWVFLLPTMQLIAGWFGVKISGESSLGWFVGKGALGVAYMLLGYCLRTVPILVNASLKIRVVVFFLSVALLWGVCAVDYAQTRQSFMVTDGFLPIAAFAFALFWLLLKTERPLADMPHLRTASYWLSRLSFGVYMSHVLVAMCIGAVLPDALSSGVMKLAIINPVTVLALAVVACLVLERITVTRKWLLLVR